MAQEHERFMGMALQVAQQGEEKGNLALGCIVVKGDEVIGRGYLDFSRGDLTAHAEMQALKEAMAATKSFYLPECTVYATYEPCPMCLGAILNAKISTLVLGTRHHRVIPSDRPWASFAVEELIEVTDGGTRRGPIKLITMVLQDRCEAMRPYTFIEQV